MSRSHRPAKTNSPALPRSGREFAAMWFSFHSICERRDCRRAKRCAGGEMPPCFAAFWPHVDECEKMKFRAFIKARADGASASEAMAAGEAEAARCEALRKRLDALDQARGKAAPAVPAEQPQPVLAITRAAPPIVARVRSL